MDPRTRATMRELEQARVEKLREALAQAEARLARSEDALRAVTEEHDADVRARTRARELALRAADGNALARWSHDDDLRRDEIAARARDMADAASATQRDRRARDEIAAEVALRLARLQALEGPPARDAEE